MARKQALQAISGQYYSNILLVDPRGAPLSTIAAKRAKWYIDRKLATEEEPANGYSRIVKLTFEPKKSHTNEFLQSILPTRCVVCGSETGLTVHHVIPLAIKRHFPSEKKDHTRQWCVLVCEEHHLEAEKLCRPIYEKSLQDSVKLAQEAGMTKNKHIYKLLNLIRHNHSILKSIAQSLSETDRLVMQIFIDKFTVLDADIEGLKALIKQSKDNAALKVKESKKEWAQSFIERNGGVDGLSSIFKTAFLALNPQFLPDGFLIDIPE